MGGSGGICKSSLQTSSSKTQGICARCSGKSPCASTSAYVPEIFAKLGVPNKKG
jgi:hypothetical protein